ECDPLEARSFEANRETAHRRTRAAGSELDEERRLVEPPPGIILDALQAEGRAVQCLVVCLGELLRLAKGDVENVMERVVRLGKRTPPAAARPALSGQATRRECCSTRRRRFWLERCRTDRWSELARRTAPLPEIRRSQRQARWVRPADPGACRRRIGAGEGA